MTYEEAADRLQLPQLNGADYRQIRAGFRLPSPTSFNLFTACLGRHDAGLPALVVEHPDGRTQSHSFGDVGAMVRGEGV